MFDDADRPERFDRRFFLPSGTHGMVERFPRVCPAGHPLGPDRMLVASAPCTCTGTYHRLWRCWACDLVWVRPACLRHPEWVPWKSEGSGQCGKADRSE